LTSSAKLLITSCWYLFLLDHTYVVFILLFWNQTTTVTQLNDFVSGFFRGVSDKYWQKAPDHWKWRRYRVQTLLFGAYRTHTDTHTRTHKHTLSNTYARTHTCKHAHTQERTQARTHSLTHTKTHTRIYFLAVENKRIRFNFNFDLFFHAIGIQYSVYLYLFEVVNIR
jgi:hypothetical protein